MPLFVVVPSMTSCWWDGPMNFRLLPRCTDIEDEDAIKPPHAHPTVSWSPRDPRNQTFSTLRVRYIQEGHLKRRHWEHLSPRETVSSKNWWACSGAVCLFRSDTSCVRSRWNCLRTALSLLLSSDFPPPSLQAARSTKARARNTFSFGASSNNLSWKAPHVAIHSLTRVFLRDMTRQLAPGARFCVSLVTERFHVQWNTWAKIPQHLHGSLSSSYSARDV